MPLASGPPYDVYFAQSSDNCQRHYDFCSVSCMKQSGEISEDEGAFAVRKVISLGRRSLVSERYILWQEE